MLDEDIRVTKQVEDRKYDLDGSSIQFIRTEFFVGKHGPFVEKFPKETWSADVRDAKLNDFARQVRT
jgi:hypothetical protein